MLEQSRAAVARLDTLSGRTPDSDERLAASLACLASERGLTRIDHVVLSRRADPLANGENVFVVQGGLGELAHVRAHMRTQDALSASLADSLQRLDALAQTAAHRQTNEARHAETQREAVGRSV